MTRLNKIGEALGKMESVTSMTDVTGFGLAGHLLEMCEGSGLSAIIEFSKLPVFPDIDYYIESKCIPGGTNRNFASYGEKIVSISDRQRAIICDPQTSGGLLVAVNENKLDEIKSIFREFGLEEFFYPIGTMIKQTEGKPLLSVM